MKLTDADKEYLREIGYVEKDFCQIERAYTKTVCEDSYGKRISKTKAIEILGREAFLSGLARSAFHCTAMRHKNELSIYFDSTKLFKENE
jgi:hypothetical protein